MRRPGNIARRLFALTTVLTGLISVPSGQTIPRDAYALSRNETEENAFSDYPPSLERPVGGIKEVIPDKYKKRYREWKTEFLSTETGRRHWEFYAHHPCFILTITISPDMRTGAVTSEFKWSDSGALIAATINLGSRIHESFPDPSYYPVINALAQIKASDLISGKIVAATIIAHEFGHVSRIASTDGALYRLQKQLAPIYNSIFRSNGYHIDDPRLIELARRMGGSPLELWENGEHWGEANAMLYLLERITKPRFQRSLFAQIKQNVQPYEESRKDRFLQMLNRSDLLAWSPHSKKP